MSFRIFTLSGTIVLTIASFWLMPKIVNQVKNNPQVQALIQTPDSAWTIISQCQKRVDDVKRCYNAWSAGVALAESTDCSPDGIRTKRRFKQLVEHNKDDEIEKELVKECGQHRQTF